LAKEGCTDCKAKTHWRQISPKKKKGAKTKLQQTLGIVMRSALPEEIEKIFQHNLISDSTLTLPHIQRCLEDMMQEMGISAAYAPTSGVTPVPIRLWFTAPELDHPLIDDNHDRPLHPLVGPFLRGYLSRYDDMDDDDDEMGHLYTSLCNTKGFACTMLEDLEIEPAVEKNHTGKTILNHQLRWNRERLSNLHTARDSNKVQEVEPESEDLQGMIRQPPKVGAIRFHHEPESINTSHLGVTATAFQGTTSVITSRGPYQLEGARWHLLTKIFSNPESFGADLHSELLLQEHLNENPKHRSFSWQVLCKASKFFRDGAKTYIGDTGLTTPLFFLNARRGAKITWGVLDDSPVIVNWSGLDPSEQAEIAPTLAAADNWIIFTHPLGPEKSATPPIPTGAHRILYTKGKAGRERGWWRTGTDKLASYGLETKVWINQDSTISNSNILALEALLQTKSEKDLPDMRSDWVESIYWAGTESSPMDIHNFPGVIYVTDGSKGSTGMGAGFYRHDTKGGGCCRVGGGTSGGSSGRAEFAAAYLALEDSLTHD